MGGKNSNARFTHKISSKVDIAVPRKFDMIYFSDISGNFCKEHVFASPQKQVHWDGSEDMIFFVGVNMLVVPEFG